MGTTGPRYTITVDGHLYRLMQLPEDETTKAAAVGDETLFMIRYWLGQHPDVATLGVRIPPPAQ